jgi:hypothetical protein
MKKYDVKYAFYSTYQHTIFLKKERRGNNWVLWHSRPIANNTSSIGVNQNLTNLVDRVSVRECFLYLQTRIDNGDWHAANHTGRWHLDKKVGNVDLQNYYANDDPNTQLGSLAPEVPSLPKKQPDRRDLPRKPQPAAGKGQNTAGSDRSAPNSGELHSLRGMKHDQKSHAPRSSSVLSKSRRDVSTSLSTRISGDIKSDSRQRTEASSVSAKNSRSGESHHRPSANEQLRPRPESSRNRSEPRDTRRLPDAQTQPRLEKASITHRDLPHLRAKETGLRPSTVDPGRAERGERHQASESRSRFRGSNTIEEQDLAEWRERRARSVVARVM